MRLLSNSWEFLRQILYTCLAGSRPLIRCFSRKLLYIYEIDIIPNFKFEFCNCTSLFLRDVIFRRIIFKFTGKNCKLNSIKLTRKCIDVHDRQRSSKLVAVGRKRREQLTHACCSHAVIRLRCVQSFQLFTLFCPTITTFKLCCRFSDSPRTWIRLLINFTELTFHLFSKFGNNCSERDIT